MHILVTEIGVGRAVARALGADVPPLEAGERSEERWEKPEWMRRFEKQMRGNGNARKRAHRLFDAPFEILKMFSVTVFEFDWFTVFIFLSTRTGSISPYASIVDFVCLCHIVSGPD